MYISLVEQYLGHLMCMLTVLTVLNMQGSDKLLCPSKANFIDGQGGFNTWKLIPSLREGNVCPGKVRTPSFRMARPLRCPPPFQETQITHKAIQTH